MRERVTSGLALFGLGYWACFSSELIIENFAVRLVLAGCACFLTMCWAFSRAFSEAK